MQHPLRYRIEWSALVILRMLVRILPPSVARACGALVGRGVMSIWPRRRSICRGNLSRAFPEWSSQRINSTTSDVFQNLGRTTFEILRITHSTSRRLTNLVDSPPLRVLEDVCAKGKGGLLVSGHIGNWELLAGWIRAMGFPLDVVVKPMRNPLSDAFYNQRRKELNLGIIHTQVATKGIVQAVRQKHLVAILADQYAGEDGVDVTFFGRKVSTPRGPAALSLKFGCPILSGIMVRTADGRFKVEIDPPLVHEPSGDHENDILEITQAFTARIENHIRRYPEQWLWTHRRWRD